MKSTGYAGGGVALEARTAGESDEIAFAGLRVEYHPGIADFMRGIALETALRLWEREVGSVIRGGCGLAQEQGKTNFVRLPGWRMEHPELGRIAYVRIAYAEREENVA